MTLPPPPPPPPLWTVEDYTTLRAAYASGARQVQYGDKMVTYDSRAQMRIVLQEMYEELWPTPNPAPGRRTVGQYFSGK